MRVNGTLALRKSSVSAETSPVIVITEREFSFGDLDSSLTFDLPANSRLLGPQTIV